MNETYIIAEWCLGAALDIFLHGMFMVYLKVTHLSFIESPPVISVSVPLVGSVFRLFIDL